MKQFTKINEDIDLSGESGFDIFLEIINEFNLLFIKHDYLNISDYSYFFTTEKIIDNKHIIQLLKRKISLKPAYNTLTELKDMRLSFYFGIKRKTLFYGFYNEDTNYVYKVGFFNINSNYLRKLKSKCLKNIKIILSEADMTKMNKIHEIIKDFNGFFEGFDDNEIKIHDGFRISKKFKINIFSEDDIDELKLNYTLLNWSRKFKWNNYVYSFVNITESYVYFYIKIKDDLKSNI